MFLCRGRHHSCLSFFPALWRKRFQFVLNSHVVALVIHEISGWLGHLNHRDVVAKAASLKCHFLPQRLLHFAVSERIVSL